MSEVYLSGPSPSCRSGLQIVSRYSVVRCSGLYLALMSTVISYTVFRRLAYSSAQRTTIRTFSD